MTTFRTIFIGDSSLLIRCAESTLLAGGDIVALATEDARVESWGLGQGISVLKGDDIGSHLATLDFDYLFSVGHPDIIAADALRRARKMAINFHDGPLPRYAGFNAPSWAIRNGEAHHGVAWHEMIERPEAGRIVARADVTIEPDETALSLNAKCYEAGFACFEDILEAIKSDGLRLEPQVGKRSYFSRSKRPAAAATLDLSQPARVIAAQVRSLNFGPYPNPLGFAKLYAGDQLLLVGNAVEVPEFGRKDAPGTVLAVEADSVVVATATIPLRLENLRSLEGTAIASASDVPCLKQGRARVPVPPQLIERIDALNQRAARGEGYWLDALKRTCPVDLPFPRARTKAGEGTHHRFQLSAPLDVDSRMTAILAWAVKVANIESVSIDYRSGPHDRDLGEAALWFSPWRPLSIDLESSIAIEDAVGAVRRARQDVDAAPPIACDLRLRAPLGEGAVIGPENISIAIAVDAATEMAVAHSGADVIAVMASDTAEVTLYLRASRFDESVARVMAGQIRMALSAVEGNGRARLADIELSDGYERELFAHASVGPQKSLIDKAIPDAVAAQAKLTPDRIAIRTRWETLTYAQLQRHVDVAARRLALLGVGPKRTIGVCLERSPELVIMLLAVMRTGAGYLPLDPTYPADRVAFMLADSQSSLVVTSRRCASRHEFADAQVALADLLLVESDGLGAWAPPPLAKHDLAYIIYTSGSTGQPKGVMISHRSVANFFLGMDAHITRDESGTWLAVTGPNFDISILELFWTLSRGFTVALHGAGPPATQSSRFQLGLPRLAAATPDDEDSYLTDFGVPTDDVIARLPRSRQVKDGASRETEDEPQFWIVEDIRHFDATHLQCTPSLASMIAADPAAAGALESVNYLMVGGEELPLSLARDLRGLLPAKAKLLNMYGPTETTIWSTVCSLDEIGDFVPLGQPIVNTTLRVVGSDGKDQPALVPGELWIGGAGIALGYWNRPELTAEQFVNRKLSESAVMYRTGDIVRRHPDGRLEFLGRRDSQVKIRGHRVELGEVEAALEEVEGVADAVVVAREDVIGDKRLVAYYVPKPHAICDDAGLQAALRDRLPEIMVPATYVCMAAFPLTPNGKIDRKALPAPNTIVEGAGAADSFAAKIDSKPTTDVDASPFGELLAAGTKAAEAPELLARYATSQPKIEMRSVVDAGDYADKTEATIARICSDVLGVVRLPPDADFMSYGGGSLAGVRAFARIRKELGVSLSLSALFQAPTVRQLAALVRAAGRNPSAPATWSPLVQMAEGSKSRRPVFCVHGAGGNVVVFKPLVDCMPHDLPVFGLQARGIDGRAPFQETIERMAASYVAAIRAIDPSGPYRLTGYSGGGVIAYEMAQQIVRGGGAVELLAMFDTLAPAEAHAPLSLWNKIRVLKYRAPLFLLSWPVRHLIFRWRNLRIRLMEKGIISDTRSHLEIIGEKAMEAFMRAQARYQPARFGGDIVLFRASEAELLFLRADWTLGWSKLVGGNIEVHEVDADHQSVFQQRSIEVIASVLNTKLGALDDVRQL